MSRALTVFEWVGLVLLAALVLPVLLDVALTRWFEGATAIERVEQQQMQIDNLQRQLNELPGYFERID
jgi:hypothetical protein